MGQQGMGPEMADAILRNADRRTQSSIPRPMVSSRPRPSYQREPQRTTIGDVLVAGFETLYMNPGRQVTSPTEVSGRRADRERLRLQSVLESIRNQAAERGNMSEGEALMSYLQSLPPDTPIDQLRVPDEGFMSQRMTQRGYNAP